MKEIPQTQYAVQLVGADKLVVNRDKVVFSPGRHQILCRVEVVGLCFSDMKLLKQFSNHVRKGEIVSGIDRGILGEIPSYVPGDAATVPGHEAVVRIEAVGPGVTGFERGQRYLVETDYRWLRTAGSNAAFGYNFEGALQEYVLMDERVITSPQGRSMLIPLCEEVSASAAAMVEPWACVEHAYVSEERQGLKAGGAMLIVADVSVGGDVIRKLFGDWGMPGELSWVSEYAAPEGLSVAVKKAAGISEVDKSGYDDVIYFGSDAGKVERLFDKVGTGGLLNIALCWDKFGREIVTPVGRVHYEGIRIVGSVGSDPAEAMRVIPATGEIRDGDRVNIVGAGGPMGVMHAIRTISLGAEGVSVVASDIDEERLGAAAKIVSSMAKRNGVEFGSCNPSKDGPVDAVDYTALMAPVPALVGEAVRSAAERGIINIFAGIPVSVTGDIDLDSYISRRLYFVGTSGSVVTDMRRLLAKVESGELDTNVCVGAVCGLESAAEGMRAVEQRQITGKIIVYPGCKGFGLVKVDALNATMPEVGRCLDEGVWTLAAEKKLLEIYC